MKQLLYLSLSILFCQCGITRTAPNDHTTCTVYQTADRYIEMAEGDWYIERVIGYHMGRMQWEHSLSMSGDTIRSWKYHSNAKGGWDSVVMYDDEDRLILDYSYDSSGRLLAIHETYNGRRSPSEIHSYTDSGELIRLYMGGSFSSSAFLEKDEAGFVQKRITRSPEGHYWGHTEYRYAKQSGRRRLVETRRYRSSGDLAETTTFTFNKNGLVLWKTVLDGNGRLLDRKFYKYD